MDLKDFLFLVYISLCNIVIEPSDFIYSIFYCYLMRVPVITFAERRFQVIPNCIIVPFVDKKQVFYEKQNKQTKNRIIMIPIPSQNKPSNYQFNPLSIF